MSSMLRDYLNSQEEAELKFGADTVVAYQVGSFLEVYAIQLSNGEWFGKGLEMQEMGIGNSSKYTDSKVTYWRGNDVVSGCKMGYPIKATDSFIEKILNLGYNLLVYTQEDIEGVKEKSRTLKAIYTPTINHLESSSENACLIASIYENSDFTFTITICNFIPSLSICNTHVSIEKKLD